MFQFINYKIINRFFHFIQLIIILLWCNISFAFELSNVTNFFKTQNNPPPELFGIEILKNINEYSKVTETFNQLDKTWAETEYFKNEIREFDIWDVAIKNSNFDTYTVYLNKKLQIEGIEGYSDILEDAKTKDANSVNACLNIKTKILVSIIELHNLNKENFKEKNYVSKYGIKDGVALKSVFKFNYDGIDLSYSLSCESFFDDNDKWSTSLYIEFFTEKLKNEYNKALNYKQSEKTLEQLVGITLIIDDLKGF